METVHEKPAFRRPFASRRCLLPADGYYEWYATEQKTKAGKPLKQPFFIHPADGVGDGDGRALRDLEGPDPRRGRPAAVPVDLHRAHHHRRGRGRPHPRPDAAAGRAGAVRRLARPGSVRRRRAARSCSCRPRPGGSRPTRSAPRSTTSATTAPSCSTRSPRGGRRTCRRDRRPARADPARRRPAAPRPVPAPGRDAAARARRRRRGRLRRTSRRWPRSCPARASRWSASSSRGGWPAGRSRRAPRCSTRASWRPPNGCGCAPRWSSAAGPPGARSAARTARELGAAGFVALSFPLHPPGTPGALPARRARGGDGAHARRTGGAGRVRAPRGVPARPGADRRAGRRPRPQGAQARARRPRRWRWRSSSRRCWSSWSATSSARGIRSARDVLGRVTTRQCDSARRSREERMWPAPRRATGPVRSPARERPRRRTPPSR